MDPSDSQQTMILGFLTMGATLASSIFSAAFEPLTVEFDIGIQGLPIPCIQASCLLISPTTVATLGIALFILAFAVGPIVL